MVRSWVTNATNTAPAPMKTGCRSLRLRPTLRALRAGLGWTPPIPRLVGHLARNANHPPVSSHGRMWSELTILFGPVLPYVGFGTVLHAPSMTEGAGYGRHSGRAYKRVTRGQAAWRDCRPQQRRARRSWLRQHPYLQSRLCRSAAVCPTCPASRLRRFRCMRRLRRRCFH